MSYCRFGDDSDVYVYMSGNGITIHVANKRKKDGVDVAAKMEGVKPKDMVDVFEDCYETIPLPCVGEDYMGLDHEEALEILTKLDALGYRVPTCVFVRLLEEMDE